MIRRRWIISKSMNVKALKIMNLADQAPTDTNSNLVDDVISLDIIGCFEGVDENAGVCRLAKMECSGVCWCRERASAYGHA